MTIRENMPKTIKLPKLPTLPRMPGKTKAEKEAEADEDPTIEEMVEDLEEDILTEGQLYFQEARKAERATFQLNTDSEYWACLVFETREQKQAFMKAFNAVRIAGGNKYLNGVAMAKALGVDIGEPTRWPKTRPTPRQLLALSRKPR